MLSETNNNEVEDFLKKSPNTVYSIKTLSRRLNIRKRHVFYLYKISDNIIKAQPFEVGSNKHNFNIFKYIE